MTAMGRMQTLPLVDSLRKLGAAPRAVGNDNHAATPVVNDDAVGSRLGPIIYQAIGAVVAAWVLFTGRVYVARHHVAAVISHAPTIARPVNAE
jgi:hypothetical protein